MAILKIARMGHPILDQVAAPVDDPTGPAVRRLVNDMLDTMEDAQGTGLAAPQVYVPKRVVMFYVSGERARREDGLETTPADVPLTVLINPTIEPLTDETEVGWEGCLSVPGIVGHVARPRAVRYHGLSLKGEEIVREASGFHARVVQHECDHLDGILYPRRMDDLSTLTFTSEIAARARAEAGEE